MPKCKLCQKEKPLIKKSHIIPDFMYQNILLKGSKMQVFNPQETINEILGGEKARIKSVPSGEYEGGILCSNCDNNVVGQYEDYASKTLYAEPGKISASMAPVCENFVSAVDPTLRWSHCHNVDYRKFKLFLLSILWRASISSRDFFSEVNLGFHEEKIRRMIWNDNPKTIFDYPVMMAYAPDTNDIPFVTKPVKTEIAGGIEAYQFIIDRAMFVFPLSNKQGELSNEYYEYTVKPTNELKTLHLPSGTLFDFILHHSGVL